MLFSRYALAVVLVLAFCVAGHAQDADAERFEVQGDVGWAGFPDNGTDSHSLFGGSFHAFLNRGVHVGAETFYLIGPGSDRDVMIIPVLGYEFRRPSRVRPFVIGGAGVLFNRQLTGTGIFWGNGWSFGAGAGVRVSITDRVYFAPEARIGWEPFARVSVGLGYRF